MKRSPSVSPTSRPRPCDERTTPCRVSGSCYGEKHFLHTGLDANGDRWYMGSEGVRWFPLDGDKHGGLRPQTPEILKLPDACPCEGIVNLYLASREKTRPLPPPPKPAQKQAPLTPFDLLLAKTRGRA